MTTPHVPPTLEGRVMVELGAALARIRRDYDAALDRLDTLDQHLSAARAAVAYWRGQAMALGYDAPPSTDEPLCHEA